MLTMSHGRDQLHEIDFSFDKKGKLHALRFNITQNLGAWPDPTGIGLSTLTSWMAAGCYKIPHVSVAYRNVVTILHLLQLIEAQVGQRQVLQLNVSWM